VRRGPDEGAEPGALTLHQRASCVRREDVDAGAPQGSDLAIDRSSADSDALTWRGSLPRTRRGTP
jgi:hypothetical protein